jgi:hypothetical protein
MEYLALLLSLSCWLCGVNGGGASSVTAADGQDRVRANDMHWVI